MSIPKLPKIKGDYSTYFLGPNPREHKDYVYFGGKKKNSKRKKKR